MEVIPEKWPAILTILPETKGTEEAAPMGSEFSGQWGPPAPCFFPLRTCQNFPDHTAGPIAGSERRMIFPRLNNCCCRLRESGPPKI